MYIWRLLRKLHPIKIDQFFWTPCIINVIVVLSVCITATYTWYTIDSLHAASLAAVWSIADSDFDLRASPLRGYRQRLPFTCLGFFYDCPFFCPLLLGEKLPKKLKEGTVSFFHLFLDAPMYVYISSHNKKCDDGKCI